MDNKTTRRYLMGKAVGGSVGAVLSFSARNKEDDMSRDILPELRIRFPDRVHPDLLAAKVMVRGDDVHLALRVGGYPVWAGSSLLDEMNGCNELWAWVTLSRDDLMGDSCFDCFSSSASAEENAKLLLDSPEIGRICSLCSIFRYPDYARYRQDCQDSAR